MAEALPDIRGGAKATLELPGQGAGGGSEEEEDPVFGSGDTRVSSAASDRSDRSPAAGGLATVVEGDGGAGGATGIPDDAPPPRRRRVSLMSAAQITKNSIRVLGHGNKDGQTAPRRIKRFSDMGQTESHLQPQDIGKLRDAWAQNDDSVAEEDFFPVINSSIGEDWEADQLGSVCKHMFAMMDTNRDGEVDWGEFCEYLVRELADKELIGKEQENPVMMCHAKYPTKHTGRLVRIIELQQPPRFLTVCQDGIACFWSSKMVCSSRLRLNNQRKNTSSKSALRITDAGFITASSKIVVSTNARDIRFYQSSTGALTHKLSVPEMVMSVSVHNDEANPDLCMLALGDFKGYVTHITFSSASEQLFDREPVRPRTPTKSSKRGLGKNMGGVVPAQEISLASLPQVLRRKGLEGSGKRKKNARPARPRPSSSPYASQKTGAGVEKAGEPRAIYARDKVHLPEGDGMNEASTQLMIIPDLRAVVSVSSTRGRAMVVYDYQIGSIKEFKIKKGVTSFDVCFKRHLIATGGVDKVLRFWNPHVPGVPMAELAGHNHSICHVMMNSGRAQVLTSDVNNVVKIWNMDEHVCLNTFVNLATPGSNKFSSKHKDLRDNSFTAMKWHGRSESMIAAHSHALLVIELNRDEVKQAADVAMEGGISAMIYIPEFNLVVTGDQQGSISTWDLTNGQKTLAFVSVHGDAMVTAFATSHEGRRLLSTSSNGEVYVWNILSGTQLQKLVRPNVKEVNALVACRSINRVYAVGWGGLMSCFETDAPVDITLTPMTVNEATNWEHGPKQVKGDDVLAVDSLTDTMIATCAFDGDLCIWDLRQARKLRTLNLKAYLKKLTSEASDAAPKEETAGFTRGSRSASRSSAKQQRRLPSHMPQTGAVLNAKAGRSVPVRDVLWLKERARMSSDPQYSSSATLVASCDGGFLCFWHVHNEDMMGSFYAVDDELGSQYVSAMVVDVSNKNLYTADSMGWIKQWDISKYARDKETTTPVTKVGAWQAHRQAVTSIVLNEAAEVVISASSDCSIRVWSIKARNAQYIGSFGTQNGWHLPIKNTPSLSQSARPTLRSLDPAPPTAREAKERLKRMRRATKLGKPKRQSALMSIDGVAMQFLKDLSETQNNAELSSADTGPISIGMARKATEEEEEDLLDGNRPASAVTPLDPDADAMDNAYTKLSEFQKSPTKLGSAYATRSRSWHKDRVSLRVGEPKRPEITDTNPVSEGLLICNPFSVLALKEQQSLTKERREPSCVARAREVRLAEEAQNKPRKGKKQQQPWMVNREPARRPQGGTQLLPDLRGALAAASSMSSASRLQSPN